MSLRTGAGRPGQTPECAAQVALLPLYALGELDADEAQGVRAHEAGCAYCQARLAEYGALRQGVAGIARAADSGQDAPFSPFSLSEIMLADQLSAEDELVDAHDQAAPASASVRALTGAAVAAHRGSPRMLVGVWRWVASRELGAVAAALLLTLAAALIFSSLRGAATLPAGPRIIEYSTPNGTRQLAGIASGPDGALWYTDIGAAQIGRMTPGGAVTLFPLESRASEPEGITSGPDGALWFTEGASSAIGRISLTGAITEYPFPISGAWPAEITRGPDGALWFTMRNAGQIGRITTAGDISSYPLPRRDALPEGIAAGPDGALWFTEGGTNQIGRISLAGAITEYPVAEASDLGAITAGPDGALWFTEAGAIGRITTAGVITRFPLPSAFILPGGITVGPDDALWFTEHSETNPVHCDGSRVGRITTSGHVSLYPLPTPRACPGAITASSSALWFIEAGQNTIGEVRPAG